MTVKAGGLEPLSTIKGYQTVQCIIFFKSRFSIS